ncbi:MAG: P-loop NTPase fold protein [Planctomycetota bacterium]
MLESLFDRPLWGDNETESIEQRFPLIRVAFASVQQGDLLDAYLSESAAGRSYPAMLRRLNAWLVSRDMEPIDDPAVDWRPEPRPTRVNGNITPQLSEEPSRDDHLDRKPFVDTLARMFAGPDFPAHTTLGLLGEWGTGKSSVRLQLEDRLTQTNGKRFCFAEFNAWRYEQTDNIAAGLAQEVVRGILQPLGFWQRALLRLRFARQVNPWAVYRGGVFLALFVGLAGVLFAFRDRISATIVDEGWDLVWQETPLVVTAIGGIAAAVAVLKSVKDLVELTANPLKSDLHRYMKLPDYGEHLGQMPVIRRQLEALVRQRLRFRCAHPEARWVGLRRFCDWVALPYRSEKSADEDHACAYRRLVLFVDDVDRCGVDAVVATLDAVRLVAEVPGVTVVVMVDSDIALQAVMHHYRDTAIKPDRPRVARDYLAKVLHTVLQLPVPEREVVKKFVKTELFKDALEDEKPTPPVADDDATDDPPAESPPQVEVEFELPPAIEPEPPTAPAPTDPEAEQAAEDRQIDAAMRFTTTERDAFVDCVDTFGFTNPRQIKRLQNGFGLLKGLEEAMGGFAGLEEAIADEPRRMLGTMFLAEFLAGLDVEVRAACWTLLRDADAGLPAEATSEHRAAVRIGQWLDANKPFGPRPPVDAAPPRDPGEDASDEQRAFAARWHVAKLVTLPPVPKNRTFDESPIPSVLLAHSPRDSDSITGTHARTNGTPDVQA